MRFDYGVDNPPERYIRRINAVKKAPPIDWPLLIMWVLVLGSCLLLWITLLTFLEIGYATSKLTEQTESVSPSRETP